MAYVEVGRLLKPHGLKGEMKAVLDLAFSDMETFFIERAGSVEQMRVESIRDGTNGVIVQLYGIETPERAREFAGALIKIDENNLPVLSEGHYYHHEIIGLEVISITGEHVGTVADILDVKSNDVYVVEGNGKEHLIPAIADVIKEINLTKGTITIEVMEGLLQG
ncbi:MAG: 16S rRNA processing protein RimM [Nitrospirae bacterium]|nr:16S rRNA processing protein RimM [Nitrospirota bacterium]